MTLKIYTLLASPPCRAAMMAAEAIRVPFELEHVNLITGDHLKPDYVKKNPQHTVPTLDDDGFVIWDSHAIATYLISKYAKDDSLYPKELKQRAIIDQRLHFDSGILFPRLRNAVAGLLFRGETKLDEKVMATIGEAYDFVEKFLSESTWIAGDKFTVADICCVATISSLDCLQNIDEKKYPNLVKWLRKCENIDFFKKWNVEGNQLFDQLIKSKLK